jgi:hypothetical protein
VTYDIRLERELRFLRVTLFGEGTLDGHKRTAELVLEECAAHGYDRVLVDTRNLTTHLSIAEAFEFAKYLSELRFTPSIRRLSYIHSSEKNHGPSFFETASYNRGVNVRAFADLDSAVQWLTE